jgi:ABC-2 type transport system ATP-binding protein
MADDFEVKVGQGMEATSASPCGTFQENGLVISHLSVMRGGERIVDDVSFVVPRGEVLGLIGPNGAGKSSTIGGLLGFYPLSSGAIQFQKWTTTKDQPMPIEMKKRIAYIPEQPMYYPDLTLAEHFEWKLRLWRDIDGVEVRKRLTQLCSRFQLDSHLDKFPHQCSKGTLQKMMVISAFLFPFDVLVVDEPFIGLDVIAIREIRQMIEDARLGGAAVLVSTHVLDSAERMCQRFAFMAQGQVFAFGTLAELQSLSQETQNSLEDLFLYLLYQTDK